MRLIEATDYPAIANALLTWQNKVDRYPLKAKPDLHKAMQYIAENRADVYVGHGFLLMVADVVPWYGTERVLQEELLLTIPEAGYHSLPRVLDFMQELATRRGADYIVAGNSSQDARLSALYIRKGFKRLSDTFTKGHQNGQWQKRG